MASKQCHFHEIWLVDPDFASWLQQEKNDSKGYCKLCKKSFNLSNMGIGAHKSHMKNKQHNLIMKDKQSPFTQPITNFLVKPGGLFLPLANLMNKVHHIFKS